MEKGIFKRYADNQSKTPGINQQKYVQNISNHEYEREQQRIKDYYAILSLFSLFPVCHLRCEPRQASNAWLRCLFLPGRRRLAAVFGVWRRKAHSKIYTENKRAGRAEAVLKN